LLESGLSETIQKNSLPEITKDVYKYGKSQKNADYYVSDSEVNEFNMIVDLDEIKRKEILINLISNK
jgi:hypothetical protein